MLLNAYIYIFGWFQSSLILIEIFFLVSSLLIYRFIMLDGANWTEVIHKNIESVYCAVYFAWLHLSTYEQSVNRREKKIKNGHEIVG